MRRQRLTLAILAAILVTTSARATELQVEGPQDSLAGAPTINHCTLRKAVINANTDTAPIRNVSPTADWTPSSSCRP